MCELIKRIMLRRKDSLFRISSTLLNKVQVHSGERTPRPLASLMGCWCVNWPEGVSATVHS